MKLDPNKPITCEAAVQKRTELDNLKLWESVERTDEKYTKPFTIPFRGTAINPDYLFKKATRVFGPAGKGWGYEITGEQILDTIPIFNDQGEQIAMEKVHTLDVMLW